jgi:Tfp pilus assembly protein PilX
MKTEKLAKSARRKIGARLPSSKRQRGLVLIITLLVLTVMMLVSVALIRSENTTVLAIANLSFRQRAEAPINQAIEKVLNDLRKVANDKANSGLSAVGFMLKYPSYFSLNQLDANSQGVPVALLGSESDVASGANVLADTTTIPGVRLYTTVDQLCAGFDRNLATGYTNAVLQKKCVLATSTGGFVPSSEHNVRTVAPSTQTESVEPVLRITVRADGDKGAVVYAQAFLRFGVDSLASSDASTASPAAAAAQ